jgi:hypothetical protein
VVLNLADAHDAVVDLAEPTLDPALTDAEIDSAIVRTAVASIWLPATAYTVGQFVVPPVPMGRLFICVLAGTSDTTEPAWLIAPGYTGPVNPYAGYWWGTGTLPFIESVQNTPWYWGLADGTCAWRDYGAFAGEIYDVRAAASEAWRMKARKAANRFDVNIQGGPNARRSQIYAYCLQMARSLQPVRIV